METLKKLLLVIFLLVSPALASAQGITEKAMKELIRKADKAVASKDVGALAQTMSDNVEIVVRVSSGGKVQTIRKSKAEYMTSVRVTWARASSYSYRRSNEKIVISGKSATVTADVIETMVVNGNSIRSRAEETVTIELVNGVAQVTRMTGNMTM